MNQPDREVMRDDGEFILQLLHQRTPHSRGLRIAMQENDGRTLTRGEVLKLFSFDFCKARLCGFACFLSAQSMFSKDAMNPPSLMLDHARHSDLGLRAFEDSDLKKR